MRRKKKHEEAVEMQMGPMIDMVFLLLVFFMVTAKPKKEESDISLRIPGQAESDEQVDLPDEVKVVVKKNGKVEVNEAPMSLGALLKTLTRFKQSADLNKVEALVTVDAENEASHQQIVNVFNICARAGIEGMTFAGTTSDIGN